MCKRVERKASVRKYRMHISLMWKNKVKCLEKRHVTTIKTTRLPTRLKGMINLYSAAFTEEENLTVRTAVCSERERRSTFLFCKTTTQHDFNFVARTTSLRKIATARHLRIAQFTARIYIRRKCTIHFTLSKLSLRISITSPLFL